MIPPTPPLTALPPSTLLTLLYFNHMELPLLISEHARHVSAAGHLHL
jgi:hypothetical protein